MDYTSRRVFLNDLNTGRKYENQILQNIKLKYPCSFLIDKHFKDYDIFIPETNVKIEVKCDFRSKDTGNIVIELFMFNKPSALLVTKANYWIIYTGDEYLWITPNKIFECLLLNNVNSTSITGRGDQKSKQVCLVKLNLLKNYCLAIQTELDSGKII